MTRILDISPAVNERIAVWPGDVAYHRNVSFSLESGHNYALSDVRSTVHVGAHADAPSHYVAGAPDIAQRPLELYYGDCQVLDASAPRGERLEPRHLSGPVSAPRVLLRTGSAPDPEVFNTDFNSLSPALVEHLHARGVVLVGIDTPSVDPYDDKELRAHKALWSCGMANLEGLVLTDVDAGRYILIALPLKLTGADASPVRAALVQQ